MSGQPTPLEPVRAAADAVKAYIRMHRNQLASDGELLALLLPERAGLGEARDFQRFLLDKLVAENVTLKAERAALLGHQKRSTSLSEGVRHFVLDLIDARSFAETIALAIAAAPLFGADRSAICVEGDGGASPTRSEKVRLIPEGTTDAMLGPGGTAAILSEGGERLLGAGGHDCRSLPVFRLKIGREGPAALWVLGAVSAGQFGQDAAEELHYAARALERAIRAWLALPRI
jgi:uncharacterized protein YigA (DUF484 family)